MARIRSALATGLTLAVAGCGTSSPTATALPTTPVAQVALGDLAPGVYTYGPFVPRIEVEVPSEGDWRNFHVGADFFDVGIETDEGVMALMFLNPSAYLPEEGEAVEAATPEAALQLLAERPGVTVSEPRQVEVGGLAGLEVDAAFEAENTHIYRVEDGLIGIGPTNDYRATYLQTDDGVLVIGLIAPAGTMARAERETRAVLDSIHIGP